MKTLLQEHGSSFISSLTSKAGFDQAQAQKFVPLAAEQSFEKIKSGAVDLDALVGKGDVTALISKLDLGALGAKSGLDAGKVTAGLKTLLPLVLNVLKQKGLDAGALKGLLGGGAAGGLAGMAGKLF
ncbi:MAG: hypothetical protein ACKV2T_44045, partial [Kofleriaceae bacterium]